MPEVKIRCYLSEKSPQESEGGQDKEKGCPPPSMCPETKEAIAQKHWQEKIGGGSCSESDMKEKTSITKNVVLISCSFAFLFTSFHSVANLQSSINKGLGTTSLCVVYGTLLISNWFLPSFMIQLLKVKWTLAVSMLTYSAFMVAQYYPSYFTLFPGAILLGLGAAPMWSAKCTYLTQVGEVYAEMLGHTGEVAITKFFGIFFVFFQSSHIIGNLISSSVFSQGSPGVPASEDFLQQCGANYCPHLEYDEDSGYLNGTHIRVDEEKVKVLSSIYLTFSLLAAAVIALLVDPLSKFVVEDQEGSPEQMSGLKLLISTVKHLKHPYQIPLIPLTLWSGLQQAFLAADFTMSFVTCSLGIHMVGYTMICYGVCQTLSSLCLSTLVRLLGRVPVFVFGAMVNAASMFLMLNYIPKEGDFAIFFVMAGLWGVGDSIWQTQMNALYGVLFADNPQAAFSNYRFWESSGFILGYILSSMLCIQWKLYLNLSVLSLGIIGYLCVEAIVYCLLIRNS